MSQWSSKIKKLFHLDRQDEQQRTNNVNAQQLQNQVETKQQSFFNFDIDHFFKRTNQHSSKSNVSEILFPKPNLQSIIQQHQKNTNNNQNFTKNNMQSQGVKRLNDVPCPSETNDSNTSQENHQKQNQGEDENQYVRDDDEDSLGYTQNEWDEQTINFQLEDHMLDCLQDQKHLSLYRQSLIQNNDIRKKVEQRLSKPNRPPSPKDNQLSEIQFEAIINQQNSGPQSRSFKKSIHQIQTQKKVLNNQRRNRFSKYKKVNENNQFPRKSIVPHFTPQQEERLDRVYKQKIKELKSKGNQTCDDYITRVFNTKISQDNHKAKEKEQPKISSDTNKPQEKEQNRNKPQVKEKDQNKLQVEEQTKNQVQVNQQENSKKASQQNKQIKESVPQIVLNESIPKEQMDELLRKESTPSDGSFQVVQGKNNISFQQMHKISSHSSASDNQLKNKFKQTIFSGQKSQTNSINQNSNLSNQIKNNETKVKNVIIWENKVQIKDHKINTNDYNQAQTLPTNEQKNKSIVNQDSLSNNQSQRLFHVLSPPRVKPISPSNHSFKEIFLDTQGTKQKENKNVLRVNYRNLQFAELSPNFKTQQPPTYSNLQPSNHSQIPTLYSPITIAEKAGQNPFLRVNNSPSNIQNPGFMKVQGSPDIRFNAGKSPRAKIQFNYVNLQEEIKNKNVNFTLSNSAQLPKVTSNPLRISPKKTNIKSNDRMLYIEPQPEERIPIFLQRLRRLISAYPNFYSAKTDIEKIQNDLKIILNGMRSAISVIQLLYKKLKIQRSRLREPLIKMEQCRNLGVKQKQIREQLQDQIWDFFINSQWQSYRIEEIQYIKPKQKFKKRNLDAVKLDEALRMYNEFIIFYLKEPILAAKTSDEIKRYIRIRQKISSIVQYLRMISEDLYTFWLDQCHYPFLYYEFLNFLKQDQMKTSFAILSDQIYAKLVLAQEYKDPLSSSIIGRKILEKIQNMCN